MKLNMFIKKYHNKVLEDAGPAKSKEFIQFAKDFKTVIKDIAKEIGADLETYHVGHYDVFGFLSRDGRYVYFSYGIPRHFPIDTERNDCMQGILVRKAKNSKDYTGGHNRFCSFTELKDMLETVFTGKY